MPMKNFRPSEFVRKGSVADKEPTSWYEHMDLNLLQMLDDFRDQWGMAVFVSRAPGAVGRQAGPNINSYHNIDRWGAVRAVDVMPLNMDTATASLEAVRLAERVGFRGIGVYPHWNPRPGLHLDNRQTLTKWGAIRRDGTQQYVDFDEAVTNFR